MAATGGYLAVLEVEVHFPDAHDLKAKRKEIKSLKALIQGRFGAAVAETDYHDKWQRAAVTAALVSGSHHQVVERADELERWLLARTPDGTSVRRQIRSVQELG